MLEHLYNRYLKKRQAGAPAGFCPLTEEMLDEHVPLGPGLYMLAFRTGTESYHTFHINQSPDVYGRLRSVLAKSQAPDDTYPFTPPRQIEFYFLAFPLPANGKRCDVERIFSEAIYGDSPIRVISTN